MTGSGRIIGNTALVPVRDLATSIAFYRDVLGCSVEIENADPPYALVRRGALMIGLQGGMDAETVAITGRHIAVQIWVDGLDALWADVEDGLKALPTDRLRPPFRQAYGVREFHVKDPDGFLMLFSEAGDASIGA